MKQSQARTDAVQSTTPNRTDAGRLVKFGLAAIVGAAAAFSLASSAAADTYQAGVATVGIFGSDASPNAVAVSQGGCAYGSLAVAVGESDRSCGGGGHEADGDLASVGLFEADSNGDFAAVSDTGEARGGYGYLWIGGVSGTGDASGEHAVSGTGDADAEEAAASGTGDSDGWWGVSGTGDAYGNEAAVAGGDATSYWMVAVSLTGDARNENTATGVAPLDCGSPGTYGSTGVISLGTRCGDASSAPVAVSQGGCAYGSQLAVAVGESDRSCGDAGHEADGYVSLGLLGADSDGGYAAVSDTGDARGGYGWLWIGGISGTGRASGEHAVSGTGNAYAEEAAASGTGDAYGWWGLSGTGDGYGSEAAVAGGDATDYGGLLAVSLTGDAGGNGVLIAPLGSGH